MATFFQKAKRLLINSFLPVIIGLFLVVAVIYAVWQEPTAVPPGDNVPAPLNVGSVSQAKEGWLTIGSTVVPSTTLDIQGTGGALGGLRTTGGVLLNTGGANPGLIVQSGNVGIGTTSPKDRLQIGSLFVYHDGGDKALGFNAYWDTTDGRWEYLTNSSAGAALWYYGPSGWPFRLRVAPGGTAGDPIPTFNPALTISGNGNVAIGTDFFGLNIAKLAIFVDHDPPFPAAGDGTAGLIIAGATDHKERLQLGYDTADLYGWIRAGREGGTTRPLVLAPDGGNVGIGTTSPNRRLEISRNDATSLSSIGIWQSGAGDAHMIFVIESATAWTVGVDNSDGQKFKISRTESFADGTNLLVLDNFFKVGIRDDGPDATLEVSAYGGTDDLLMLSSDTSDDGNLLIVKNSGNVGIGTTDPQYKLDVNGQARIDGAVIRKKTGNNGTVSGDTYCQGTGWGGWAGTCIAQKRTSDNVYFPCSTQVNSTVINICVQIP